MMNPMQRAALILALAALPLDGIGGVAASETPPAAPKPAPETPGVVGMIRGTVYDAQRRPLAGQMVQLVARDGGALLRVTGTDERGEYVFADLPAGIYDVEIAVAGRPQKKESISVRPPFRNIVDFSLGSAAAGVGKSAPPPPFPRPPAAAPPVPEEASAPGPPAPVTVRGRFTDKQKRPIPEVSVTFVPAGGGRTFQAFSAEDGSFVIEGMAPGSYRVLVASPGHVGLDLKTVHVAPVQGLNLSLSLVDHPLNFKERREAPPREEPRAAPEQENPGD